MNTEVKNTTSLPKAISNADLLLLAKEITIAIAEAEASEPNKTKGVWWSEVEAEWYDKLVQKFGVNALSQEDKVHYEALLECCNKLLDSVDAGKVSQRQIIGLRILLNRPQS